MLKRLMEILEEKGLDANSFFFLYSIANLINTNTVGVDVRKLFILKYWSYDEDNKGYITKEGIDFVKYVVTEIKKEITKEKKQGDTKLKEAIKEWISEYRDLFKGTKAGGMGDSKSCLDKMVRFHEEYSEFANKELILSATKKYIQTESTSNYKYLQRADYFIYKLVGKDETSRLASFCSDVEENQGLEHTFTKVL